MPKTIRSLSTVPVSCNVGADTRDQLREWAQALDGRIGLVLERLVAAEVARREERAKMRRELHGGDDHG